MPISRTPVGRSVLKKSWDSMIDTLLFLSVLPSP